jgi:hypothetical protein
MAEPVPQQSATDRPSMGRTIAAALCIVLAAVLTVPAAVAFWGQRTINDSQRYIQTIGTFGGLAGGSGRDRDEGHRRDPGAGGR